MEVEQDDLSRPQVRRLLAEHHEEVHGMPMLDDEVGPSMDGLADPDQTVWSVWRDGHLMGLGTLKELPDGNGEIESMRTPLEHRGQGVATFVLKKLLDEARDRGYHRVSVQTSTRPAFETARRLYARHGFVPCGPFADWEDDPQSVFLTLDLMAVQVTS
ncbi:MAG: GNAT family N-acetyltransferase [Dermatophilaceae bacterium]